MLFLLFQLGDDRYALEASRVVEVVPLLSLKKIPKALRAPWNNTLGACAESPTGYSTGRAVGSASACGINPPALASAADSAIPQAEPEAAQGVAGLFVYRGRAIPALDLCALTMGRPARERLSTRIIIINAGGGEVTSDKWQVTGSGSPVSPVTCHVSPGTGLLGLIAERATEMMRRDVRDFVEAGAGPVESPETRVEGQSAVRLSTLDPRPSTTPAWLGPVLIDDRGVIQLLHAQKLSAENVLGLWNVSG